MTIFVKRSTNAVILSMSWDNYLLILFFLFYFIIFICLLKNRGSTIHLVKEGEKSLLSMRMLLLMLFPPEMNFYCSQAPYSLISTTARQHVYISNMAESSAPSSSSGPNLNPCVSCWGKMTDRKDYFANRDASKIYLYNIFGQWREFKSKKNVAQLLLDAYQSQNKSRYILYA